MWPVLATLLERRLYDARNVSKPMDDEEKHSIPDNVAVSIKNLGKTFSTSLLRPKKNVITAVDDLTLDIPKHGIFVLLGSNGYVYPFFYVAPALHDDHSGLGNLRCFPS